MLNLLNLKIYPEGLLSSVEVFFVSRCLLRLFRVLGFFNLVIGGGVVLIYAGLRARGNTSHHHKYAAAYLFRVILAVANSLTSTLEVLFVSARARETDPKGPVIQHKKKAMRAL